MKQRHYNIFSHICLTSVLALTGLAMATSQFGWSLYLEIFSHFQVQYFLAALIIAATAALLRNYRLLLVILFCTALLSAQVMPWYIPVSLGGPSTNYRIVLANLNFNNEDAGAALTLIDQEQPDLALFLETGRPMEQQLTALKRDYPYSTTPEDGILLYSKYPLTDIHLKQFGRYARESLTAHFKVFDTPISLVAVHPLPPIESKMFLSRNTLLNDVGQYIKAQTDAVIFLGDLNITMWSPYYQHFIQQTQLKNTRQGFGIQPTWPRVGSYFGLPRWTQWLISPLQIPIDHCLVSPQIRVADVHTGTDTGSDHAPLVVDLVIPAAKPA
ncbi:endonuclease/exonuclease/phosphatase family protein [Leptothoe kymatousa]|uniref:Endonuclease/exonuclease/phosphatase family protein n=1 Tax=Leptothoe kymatousa TAU-MAC 1615 TaxID=2364775 RepID=A0ABS5Y4C0_9CYAN|nr:endonuclease/exonuclease/phosphatase family protein [Leptothoe kymatousa]MBT9312672.1 endonuclease/exonuclease/phosphatase family protein [Leptothoe kymatousa TAU-MAC 1615]